MKKRFIIEGLVLLCVIVGYAYAQNYIAIPNEPSDSGCPSDPTQCSGYKTRQDINDRFSGVVAISPALIKVPFANLGVEQDAQLKYCTDCLFTTPCTSGGSGAVATGVAGVWNCSNGPGTLTGNVVIYGSIVQVPQTPGPTTSLAVDWSKANNYIPKILSGNTTVTFSNLTTGEHQTVILQQAAVGGPYSVTWPTVKWEGGIVPTMTLTVSKKDRYDFYYDGTDILGVALQNF